MSADEKPDKPVWLGFTLLGLRFARSLTEIADVQARRVEQNVRARTDAFYAQRELMAAPKGRALHMISSLFDDVMDRLRGEEPE